MPYDHLPESIRHDIERIVVQRQGSLPDAFMNTESVVGHVAPRQSYRLHPSGLEPDTAPAEFLRVASEIETPPFAVLRGTWNRSGDTDAIDANILGGLGTLVADCDTLVVPAAPTTPETLAYYGACLVSVGERMQFETDHDLPLTIMHVGASYAADYLHDPERGGGVYLEYHDRPHFHMPLSDDARGYLLLGKEVDDGWHLSGFQIPYGKAIYTPPWVLHDDAFLVGRYAVVYSVTEHFSTVVFKQADGALVRVKISPEAERGRG